MGRKERRIQEREAKKAQKKISNEQVFINYMKSQAKKADLSKKEKEKISENLINIQLACTTNAMAMVLHQKYNFNSEQIFDVLEEIENLTSMIGTSEEYPTPSQFKIKCALATGINISLTKEEKEEVEKIYKVAWEDENSDEYTVETE